MKNVAKFWRNFPLIFVLQLPGKLATRNFTQIPPHIRTSNSTRLNQNSFTTILWELVGPTFLVCKEFLAFLSVFPFFLWEFQGATRLGATGLRGSEREICLWEGLWEDLCFRGFQRFSEGLRGFQRFWEVFRGFSKALSETLSECHFPLRVAGRVAPNCVAP